MTWYRDACVYCSKNTPLWAKAESVFIPSFFDNIVYVKKKKKQQQSDIKTRFNSLYKSILLTLHHIYIQQSLYLCIYIDILKKETYKDLNYPFLDKHN